MKRLILISLVLLPALCGAQDPGEAIKTLDLLYRASKAVDSGREALERDDLKNIPSGWPCAGALVSSFGYRVDPFTKRIRHHNGIDIANRTGTKIRATGGGIVKYAGRGIGYRGYGNIVVIEHSPHLTTRYAHLDTITVEVGDEVTRGDLIGRMGSTGRSKGPHLHYEVRVDGVPVDPESWL